MMGKSKSPASRAKANRDKGRLGEFLARLIAFLIRFQALLRQLEGLSLLHAIPSS